MAILGVPDIGILKPVHVNIELIAGVDVHISNEEMYDAPSLPPSFEFSRDCILCGTSKSASASYQLRLFFYYRKNAFTLLLAVAGKNLKYEFPQF